MEKSSRIYVAGHRGLVGSALYRRLKKKGYFNILTRTSAELDLIDQRSVAEFFALERPEYVLLAAAKVGGILANNTYPAEFIYQNMMIQNNIIHHSYLQGVKRLLFLGSSCIYPKYAQQPLKEEYLMTGALEPTNKSYAIAKISGIEMCWSYNRQYGTEYIPVMPTNIYGPNDNYDLETSHVLPALLRKFHLAKLAADGDNAGIERDERHYGIIPEDIKDSLGISSCKNKLPLKPTVKLWGTGTPRREFLYVDDLADACVHVMSLSGNNLSPYLPSPLFNIGTGKDLTIKELSEIISQLVRFQGKVVFDAHMPDGTPQKLLDITRLQLLGWQPQTELEEGIRKTYQWYLKC